MAWKTEQDFEFDNNDDMEFWNPEAGDSLEGTVKINPKKGAYEKYYLVIEDEDGNTWATTQCARLDFQIKKMKIKEGDYVLIEYNGRLEENNAHDYTLYVDVEEEDE